MNIKIPDFPHSKILRRSLMGLAILIAVILIFQGGVFVGYRKASFSYRWSNNYERNFGGMMGGLNKEGRRSNFGMMGYLPASGAVGTVISVNFPEITIAGNSAGDAEKIAVISGETQVRKLHNTIKSSEIAAGDYVMVIGEPDTEGKIKAKLIRLMPAQSSAQRNSANTPTAQ